MSRSSVGLRSSSGSALRCAWVWILQSASCVRFASSGEQAYRSRRYSPIFCPHFNLSASSSSVFGCLRVLGMRVCFENVQLPP